MKTKIYKLFFLISIFILSLGGCESFLEVERVGRTTMPNFFSDVPGLRAGLMGCYSEFYKYYSSEFYKYPEVAGNMVDLRLVSADQEMISQYNFISSPEDEIGAVGYIWRKTLVALANVNNVLEYYPSILEKFPERRKEIEQIKAQALFMRALCHFDLSRVYAQPYNYTPDASHIGIPILTVTPGPDDNPSRKSMKKVYDQIIKDLTDSESLFNEEVDNPYFISKNAVQALLSRVYLYKEDWENVIRYSTSVINNSELAYGADYLKMYNGLEAGKEAIFRLNGSLKSLSLGRSFYSSTEPLALPADTLLSLFDNPEDIRLSLFRPEKVGSSTKITLKYYISVDFTPEQERYDPFILRVSEMYLNRAEAYLKNNQPDKAVEDLKVIIGRALDKPASEVTLTYTSPEDLMQKIKIERAKELCFEGHQFFDIVRWKDDLVRGSSTASDIKFLPYPNDLFVLPIPQTELNANTNMVGNNTVNK